MQCTSKKKELPCGCKMWSEGEKFFIKPCRLDCPNYQYALEESKKRGNELIFRNEEECVQCPYCGFWTNPKVSETCWNCGRKLE